MDELVYIVIQSVRSRLFSPDVAFPFESEQYHHPDANFYPQAPKDVVQALEHHPIDTYTSGSRVWKRADSDVGIAFQYQTDLREVIQFFATPYFDFLKAQRGHRILLDQQLFPTFTWKRDCKAQTGFEIPGTLYFLGFRETLSSTRLQRRFSITVMDFGISSNSQFRQITSIGGFRYRSANSREDVQSLDEVT